MMMLDCWQVMQPSRLQDSMASVLLLVLVVLAVFSIDHEWHNVQRPPL